MGRLRVTLGRPTNRSTARQGSVKNDTFTHNDRSELTAATLGTDAYSYSYDNIGNRKTAQEAAEEATAYDANNLNQYTAIQTGEETAFVPTFDADGNQTKVKTSTGIWNVVYNAENRPVTFTSEDGATIVECTYDYMGRRHTRKITVNGSVTNHLRYIYRSYLQIAAINAVSGAFQWFILWDPTQPVATRPLGIRKDGTWYTYGWDLTKNICESARRPPKGRLREQAVRAIGQTRSVCPAGARSREAAPSQVFSSGGTILTAYTYTAVLREVLFDVVYLKNISLLYAENGRFFAFQHPDRRFTPVFPAVRSVIRHTQTDVVGDDFRLAGRNRRPGCRLCRSGRRRRQKEKRKKNLFHNTIH